MAFFWTLDRPPTEDDDFDFSEVECSLPLCGGGGEGGDGGGPCKFILDGEGGGIDFLLLSLSGGCGELSGGGGGDWFDGSDDGGEELENILAKVWIWSKLTNLMGMERFWTHFRGGLDVIFTKKCLQQTLPLF